MSERNRNSNLAPFQAFEYGIGLNPNLKPWKPPEPPIKPLTPLSKSCGVLCRGEWVPAQDSFPVDHKPMEVRVCEVCGWRRYREPPETMKPLTPRQREITHAYFAAGCRTRRAARALGLHSRRIRGVKALPAAKALLAELQAKTQDAIVQARAAQLMGPML